VARLKFRHRIGLLLLLAALGLVTVTAVTLVLGSRGQQQLTGIETRYVPLIELDRDLEASFARVPRALEDAASAAEESGLHDADALADELIRRIDAGHATIVANGGDPRALVAAFRRYFDTARAVSAAIVAGTPGDELTARIAAMRRDQQAFEAALDTATSPDRRRIAAAFATARESQTTSLWIDIAVACCVLALMSLLSWRLIRRTVRSLHAVSAGVERLARGDFGQEIDASSGDEFGELALEANRTAGRLREYREQSERENWIKTGVAELAQQLTGELDTVELGRRAMTYVARYLGAEIAVVYVGDEAGTFRVLETYGVADPAAVPATFRLGETLLGQAARDDEVRALALPPDYLRVESALGAARPNHVVVVPLGHEGRAMGVIELGLMAAPGEREIELLSRMRGTVGVALRVAESRQRAQTLLAETRRQAEELRAAYDTLETRNATLVSAQQLLEVRAEDLARASRYKSEFLANMSHELRTPLNSIMILSKVLAEDDGAARTDKQVEFAGLIHKSGEELLTLINEVLDLAKIEAGKQTFTTEAHELGKVADYVRRMFTPIAAQKRLDLAVVTDDGVPPAIRTDWSRLVQILKNLIANAFKFTEHGGVTVRISRELPAAVVGPAAAAAIADPIAITVRDTGIGIPADKQQRIFEAFTQADSGTSRKYGGTGLGLTIASELATRLGGLLAVESEVGVGSSFHLVLPSGGPRGDVVAARPARPVVTLPPATRIPDDRDVLAPGDPCMLIVEDDRAFAGVVLELVRGEGWKGVVTPNGGEAVELARRFRPSGIVLDVGLPDVDGWSVMEALKRDVDTHDIPVHFITAATGDAGRAKELGAVGFTSKPVDGIAVRAAIQALEAAAPSALRRVLVVEPDPALRTSFQAVLAAGDVVVDAVDNPRDALARMAITDYGCLVMNAALPDVAAGTRLIESVRAAPLTAKLPIVVHTDEAGAPSAPADDPWLVVLHGARAEPRAIEEARAFLHRVRTELPATPRPTPELPAGAAATLDGKKVLLVDDDMRNVYSLSSALRGRRLEVITAADGQEALDELARHPDVDVVLMDVMMPVMDGHEATRRIRQQERFATLPIIALTARTGKGEREKCLAAGANDYVAKPVDVTRLLGLIRVWLEDQPARRAASSGSVK
jgi:CheY-like chemotaxis protein/antitoxin (DNA-binding transcriptional repressor) of toxin-antitoxin stability system